MLKYFEDNLKCICTSSISCNFNGTYVLEPRFGKIVFNFPENINLVKIHFKRLSGNGKILINNIQETIFSKNIEIKNVIDFLGNICISRPLDSVGEIAILGIEVHLEEEKEVDLKNWKSIVKSFKNYKGLSLVNNNLLASEGAFIEPQEMVKDLVTEPANVFFRKDNKLIFNYSCKIVSLEIADNITAKQSKDLFQIRDLPFPLNESIENKINLTESNQILFNQEKILQDKRSDLSTIKIIYDSDPVKGLSQFYHRNNKVLKFINTNNKHHIVLKPKTNIFIPVSGLELNKQYILIVNGKKINGNGKVRASLSSSLDSNSPLVIFNGLNEELNFELECKNLNDLKINIGMSDDSIGEVIISRLLLIEGLNIEGRYNSIDIHRHQSLNYKNKSSLNNSYSYSEISTRSSNYEGQVEFSSIRDLCKDSAWISAEDKDKYFNINCNVMVLSRSSRQYIANLSSYIGGIKVYDPHMLINNVNRANAEENKNLVMGQLGRLIASERLYVEEWGNNQLPSQQDLLAIENSKKILTTSNYNYVYLKTLFPKKNIQVVEKPRIHIPNLQLNKSDYFVYFEKNISLTQKLIEVWKNKSIKLYIIGTNLNVPENVEKVSEYSSYHDVYSLISNASGLIDLHKNNQYNSSWTELCKNLGCKIITNNIQNINSNYGYLNLNKNFNFSISQLDQAINNSKPFEIKKINSEIEFKNFLIG